MKKLKIFLLASALPCLLLRAEFGLVLADDAATTNATSAITANPDAGIPPTSPPDASSTPQLIRLTIRDGSNTAFSDYVNLPDQSADDLLITTTDGSTTATVSPRSVLGVLESLEKSSTSFNITNLLYYPSYNASQPGSFYIKCIAVPLGESSPECSDWTDAVNGTYPQVGIDRQILNDGDLVYLFFGQPRIVTLLTSTVDVGQPFTVTAEQYDLSSGDYKPFPGATLGVGTPNSDFTFTELATSTADTNGHAIFTLNSAGTFSVGIKEDYYFPSVNITVTQNQPPPTPVGGGGGVTVNHAVFNIPNALAFITVNQNADGYFDSPLNTDWAAIALAATDPAGPEATKIRSFLQNARPALLSVTDYERHAMALEALGINPYSGTPTNYIAGITNAFDGTQIGAPSDNDDIFALIVLKSAGFTPNDQIIQKVSAYILKSQNADGSWDETPDLTAAAMQALGSFPGIAGTDTALKQAIAYLKSNQTPDGGFGNIDSTSWTQTAINGLIETRLPNFETESAWISSSGLLPADALANGQQPDGGTNAASNRVWSTSYALAAASGKSWPTILQSFPKPVSLNGGANNIPAVLGASTTTPSALPSPEATTTLEADETVSPVIIGPIIKTATTAPANIFHAKSHAAKPPKNPLKTSLLGETTKPQISAVPQNLPEPSAVPNRTNFFGRAWNSILSFFSRLF